MHLCYCHVIQYSQGPESKQMSVRDERKRIKYLLILDIKFLPVVMTHNFSTSTWESEAVWYLWVQGQPNKRVSSNTAMVIIQRIPVPEKKRRKYKK